MNPNYLQSTTKSKVTKSWLVDKYLALSSEY